MPTNINDVMSLPNISRQQRIYIFNNIMNLDATVLFLGVESNPYFFKSNFVEKCE